MLGLCIAEPVPRGDGVALKLGVASVLDGNVEAGLVSGAGYVLDGLDANGDDSG